MLKSYDELRKVDVKNFCEYRDARDDKGKPIQVPYLNWAKCMDLLHENGAEKVYFEPVTNENGSSLFMSDQVFTDKNGVTNRCYEVRVKITIDDLEFTAQYPLMNGSNPVKDNSMTQQRLWNAQTRAFVKGVAMRTGLGFSLWLNDDEADDKSPMEDLARAVKEIFAQADKLCLDTDNYSVWGASAGGHLAASFGTKNMGYEKYNLPKPKAMVLAYPVITMGELAHPGSKENLIGADASEEMIAFASIEKQVTEDYPATFVFHGADDQTVPVENSRMFAEALKKANVPYEYVEYPGVIHGVGIAKGLICEDWFERALSFWRKVEG